MKLNVFKIYKSAILCIILSIKSICIYAQNPGQQFWVLNQPHYIHLNGSDSWQFKTNTAGIPYISGPSITLTTNAQNQAVSAFYHVKMNFKRDFTATFTFTPSGNRAGNGFTFVIQNMGSTVLGGGGGYLGYSNPAITQSVALGFDLYASNGAPGIKYATNGASMIVGAYTSVSPVVLTSANSKDITITYNYAAKSLTVNISEQNTTNTYTKTYTSVDIPALLGEPGMGWVGFTAATGSAVETQVISNFVFK